MAPRRLRSFSQQREQLGRREQREQLRRREQVQLLQPTEEEAVIVIEDSGGEEEQVDGTSSSRPVSIDLSPGFRNVAAMAGWDDESVMLLANGTPAARSPPARKRDARTPSRAGTPDSANRVRRKPRLPSLAGFSSSASLERLSISETDDPSNSKVEGSKGKAAVVTPVKEKPKPDGKENAKLEQLREELSCAVCLDICYEPSTTSCGHSFCKSCLKSVVGKCSSRCPKCRQEFKGNVAVNVVLWNTIQILFPEVAARKVECKTEKKEPAAAAAPAFFTRRPIPEGSFYSRPTTRSSITLNQRPFRVPRQRQEAALRRQQESDAEVASRLQEAELLRASAMDLQSFGTFLPSPMVARARLHHM